MIYYVVALWSAAAVPLFNQPRSEVNRWAAFFLWSAGIGGLTDLLVPAGFIAGGTSRGFNSQPYVDTVRRVNILHGVYPEARGS